MQYIKLNNDKYIEYDPDADTSRVIVVSELETQIAEAQSRLNAIPAPVPDEELLAWAKLNHPQNMDYSKETETLQSLIAENSAILLQLNGS